MRNVYNIITVLKIRIIIQLSNIIYNSNYNKFIYIKLLVPMNAAYVKKIFFIKLVSLSL